MDNEKKKIKLYMLTGFLGAGKTTLLLHILQEWPDRKVGVIQNEFAKISIDGDIMRNSGDVEMVEISRGSIFCTCLKLTFVEALAEMSKQDLDYVFVESSGLADPSNLKEIMKAVEVFCQGQPYELAGTICLVDAPDFLKAAEDMLEVRRQISHCNIAVINKCDLVDRETIDKIHEKITQINGNCLQTEVVMGAIEPEMLEQDMSSFPWAKAERSLNTADTRPKTFSISFGCSVDKDKMDQFLKTVLGDCYRIKGFCRIDEEWTQVDVVGDRIDYKRVGEQRESKLIFISKVGIALIRSINDNWNEIVGKPVQLRN